VENLKKNKHNMPKIMNLNLKIITLFFGLFLLFSCTQKQTISKPENVRNAILTSIEIPKEGIQNEVIPVKINYMLFNPCWSFYDIEKSIQGNDISFVVNIQKQTDDNCIEMIVNTSKVYDLIIKEKGNYKIKFTNDKREEIIIPLLVK